MTRPPKYRQVHNPPPVVVYKPAGVPARGLTWITLALDEYEAIRRIDYEGQDQETTAAAMGVSRPTVTRIYQSARKKIARVLVQGEALMIEGGPVIQIGSDTIPPSQPGSAGGASPGRGRRRGQSQGRGQGRGRGRQRGNYPGDMT